MAKQHYNLGQEDKCRSILNPLAEEQIAANDSEFMRSLIKAELLMGLQTEALQQCARMLDNTTKEEERLKLLNALFGDKGLEADVWCEFLLSAEPGKPFAELLGKVQRFLDCNGPNAFLRKQLAKLKERASTLEGNKQGKWMRSIAAAYDRIKQAVDAAKYVQALLESSSDLKDLLWAGDFCRSRKEWKSAADAYGKAVAVFPASPIAHYLRGMVNVELGFTAEGKRQMRLGELLPLGSLSDRARLIDDLSKHNLHEARFNQRLLVLQLGADHKWEFCESLRARGTQREEKKDFRGAALDRQRFCIRLLTDMYFYDIESYLDLAHDVRKARIFEHLERGRWSEAVREVRTCLKFSPSRMWTLVMVVQALDKHNHKAAAELYQEMLAIYKPLAQAYPESGYYVGCLAWLSAECNRDLAQAFEQATKANNLFPNQTWILETLAILYRKQRNYKEAISLIERCVKLQPDSDYYRKELKKYRSDLTGSFD
jgi:tetratricopeptide (TPR) repeat protein